MASPVTNIKHLYNRAAFGCEGVIREESISTDEVINDLIAKQDGRVTGLTSAVPAAASEMTTPSIKEKLIKMRQQVLDLNIQWIEKLATTNDPLREKMVLFWHDHFACRSQVPLYVQQQNNLLRHHALGSFRDMLMGVSKDPAMLQFLNNQQNKKGHPNENFARELMELFTLGEGKYTEDDVKEAARAFTGWGFNKEGKYVFREQQHDFGVKTFRGVTTQLKGEEIIDNLLDDRNTARFMTNKLVSFFTGQSAEEPVLNDLSASFYQSDYNIKKLVEAVFSSSWFYKDHCIGNRIKSPVELLIGIIRQTKGSFENPSSVLFIQRALGNLLFYPPNVGGWPQGKEWIDSSSLTFRMSLPSKLFQQEHTTIEAKDDGDVNSPKDEQTTKRTLTMKVDWKKLSAEYLGRNEQETFDIIESTLLLKPVSASVRNVILRPSSTKSDEPEFVKRIFTGLMSTPEYQLC